jgi:hypothetical protein
LLRFATLIAGGHDLPARQFEERKRRFFDAVDRKWRDRAAAKGTTRLMLKWAQMRWSAAAKLLSISP